MPLTELKIKHLKPRGRLYRVTDGNGLTLTITPAGGKLWHVRYRYNGKQQIYSLGKYPLIGLAQARKGRDEVQALLLSGKHPTREKRAAKLRRSIEGENTFENVCRKWLDHKSAALNAKYAKQTLARMEQHVFPMIGDLPITEITIPDCVRVLEKIAKHGTIETAKRMKQVISQTFRYAAQRGLCVHNPASDMRDVLPPTQDKHYPCIPIAEFPELLRKMDDYSGDILTVGAMHLLALTFVRTGELIGAKWNEIDLDKAEWSIPKERMKMKNAHLIPLSKQAIKILKDLHKITGNRDHVFHSGAAKSKHISNGTVLMALRRMGYKGRMTGHGFRALASSILYEKNYNPHAIELQLAHKDENDVRSSYNYQAKYLLERKKMMQDYADYLGSLRSSYVQENVVKISTKTKGT